MSITVKKSKLIWGETYHVDTEGQHQGLEPEAPVPVTFCTDSDKRHVFIWWSSVRTVKVHAGLLVKTLRSLGYKVEKA